MGCITLKPANSVLSWIAALIMKDVPSTLSYCRDRIPRTFLLGVLLSFRQYAVPFMGYLEQMYNQIYVSENLHSLLRFLWWPDRDTSKDIVEYKMCVHLFGAISSPSVAGYELKKAAVDNMDTFGVAASKAVLKYLPSM